jgi:hypothetical protein
MLMKNPLTPAGIEPTTFRFVAQHLNHWRPKKNLCAAQTKGNTKENIGLNSHAQNTNTF